MEKQLEHARPADHRKWYQGALTVLKAAGIPHHKAHRMALITAGHRLLHHDRAVKAQTSYVR